MTLNVALGIAAPAVQPKSGDRGSRNAESHAQGFNEALSGKNDKRADEKRTREADDDTRPGRVLDRFSEKLGLKIDELERVPEENANPDENFDAILDGAIPAKKEEPGPILIADAPDARSPVQVESDDDAFKQPSLATDDAEAPQAKQNEEPDVSNRATPPLTDAEPLTDGGRAASASVGVATATSAIQGGVDPAARQSQTRNANAPARANSPVDTTAFARTASQNGDGKIAEPPLDTTTGKSTAIDPQQFSRSGKDGATSDSSARGMNAPTGADALSGRVNVLGFSAAIAPSATGNPLLSQTAAGVISAMESDATWRSAALENGTLAGQRAPSFSGGVNTLRIQLNPIELGMVTAKLTATGNQLSVEIQVESNDARQKLSADSESILKALRAVGYDVEKVTITQSSQNASNNGQQASAGRDQFQPNQQAQGDSNARGQGGNRSGGGQEPEGARHGSGEKTADRAGGSVYI